MSAGNARSKTKLGKGSQPNHNVKNTDKVQATPEQIRIAQLTDTPNDDPHDLVRQLREITGRADDDIYYALHDCNNDMEKALSFLLEGRAEQSEWKETTKKKKGKAKPSESAPILADKENKPDNTDTQLDRSNQYIMESSGPPRRGRGSSSVGPRLSRGGGPPRDRERSRGNRDGDDNRDRDRGFERGRGRGRGLANGPNRGRGRSRGGGFGHREEVREPIGMFDSGAGVSFDNGPKIDTWSNDTAIAPKQAKPETEIDTWEDSPIEKPPHIDDWTSEDWQGSLAESKVFTPSSVPPATFNSSAIADAFTVAPPSNTASFSALGTSNTIGSSGDTSGFQRLDLGALGISLQKTDMTSINKDQYLSQYNKQATESIKNAVGIGSPTNSASPTPQSTGGQRSKHNKSKIPPPSKIPSSAVEMPKYSGDSSLGVQFGNLDFGNDNSFGFGSESGFSVSATSSSLVNHLPSSNTATSTGSLGNLDGSPQGRNMFQTNVSNTASPGNVTNHPEPIPFPGSGDRSLANQLSQQAKSGMGSSPPTTSISFQAYSTGYSSGMAGGYNNSGGSGYNAPSGGSLQSILPPTTSSFSSNTSSQYGHPSYQGSSYSNQPNFLYGQSSQNSSGYQGGSAAQGSSYGSGGVSSQGSLPYTSNAYRDNSSYQTGPNQYQGASQKPSSTVYGPSNTGTSSPQNDVYGTTQASVYQSSITDSVYSTTTATPSYQNDVTQTSAFSTSDQSTGYQRDSQSAYGSYGNSSSLTGNNLAESIAKVGLQDSSGKDESSASSQIGQSPYDNTSSTSSVGLTATTTTVASLMSTTIVSSNTLMPAMANMSSVVTSKANVNTVTSKAPGMSFPPGMPPLMAGHNYILGQPGITGYFPAGIPQQTMYGYDIQDMQAQAQAAQLLQHRLPLGYYDMQPFQTQTTIATGRDQTNSVPYSGSEKMNRVDAQSPTGNQTQTSQQTQSGHQPAFINPTMPPYYFYQGGMMPAAGGFQYSSPFPLVNQVPAVTNAQGHVTSTGTAQFPKTGAYGSHGYGTGYDELSQSQDFSKSAYGGMSQTQAKVTVASMNTPSSAFTDLTGAAYTKTHPQSFEKQGFATNTPPPYNLQMPGGTTGSHLGAPAYGQPFVMNPMNMVAHQPGLVHHPMQQDSSGTARNTQPAASQQKPKAYSTGYWGS